MAGAFSNRQHIRHPQRQKRTGSRTDPRNRQRKLAYAPHVRGRAKIAEQIKRQKTNGSRQRQIAPDERVSARQQSDNQRNGQQPANTQQFRHEHADDEQRQQKPIHIERPKQHILHPRLLFRAHEIIQRIKQQKRKEIFRPRGIPPLFRMFAKISAQEQKQRHLHGEHDCPDREQQRRFLSQHII